MKRPFTLLLISAGGVAMLIAVGRGELATPPHDALGPWLDARGAVVAGFALLRVGALVAGCYLVIVSSLHCLAGVLGSRSLASFTTLMTAPALTSIVVVGSVAPALADANPPATSDRLVELPAVTQPTPADTATMHLLDEPSAPAAAPAPTAAPAPAPDTWTVAPGDSFWSIASDALHDARGHAPADDEVLPYWQSLIAANHDILVVPGNADLLFPGQVVTLLPVTAAP
jgi:hypothetical protein